MCSDHGSQFKPTRIVVDYEKRLQEGIKRVWADIEIEGYRFHLARSWWRKTREVGLSNEYKDETSEIGKWLKNIFELPLLKPDKVGVCFAMDFISYMSQNCKLT